MKAIATNNTTTNKRLFVLFVLLVLSSARMFGQEAKNVIVAPVAFTNTIEVAAAGDATDSQMELVSWFMGSKQSQVSNTGNTSGNISTNKTGKKQFINNGITTNRILSRVFLKKTINHDSTIA
jgi:hypothetical protein